MLAVEIETSVRVAMVNVSDGLVAHVILVTARWLLSRDLVTNHAPEAKKVHLQLEKCVCGNERRPLELLFLDQIVRGSLKGRGQAVSTNHYL